ncbi:helix-turn-helix domain-containing protein [Streptomyces murinus]|uniref:helix-turn-helix domain-containing protein n=1 Tax=Streptomyces murinus TaxID=33900 RepID=UPI0038119853
MPRGCPEKAVDETIPELAQLAREMRTLRYQAELTLDQLAARVNWSKASLQAATTGTHPPRWELVSAWVTACRPEANMDLWNHRYATAARSYRAHHGLDQDFPTAPPNAIPQAAAGQHSKPPGLEGASQHTLASPMTRWGVRDEAESPHRVTPIPIRFTPAPVDLMDGPPPVNLHGHYPDLPALFALLPSRRLVILGQPGSGKSALALHLGRTLLRDQATPVKLSLASWHPARVPLLEWIAENLNDLTAEHFTAERVSVLLGAGQLLPILDDFDQIDRPSRARALEEIDAQLGSVILISAAEPFRALVESANTPLTRSSGIVLSPLNLGDLDGWLQQTNRADEALVHDKWQPVLAKCRSNPDDLHVQDLLETLSVPSLACAARLMCSDGRADPEDLLRKTSRYEIERQLIETGYLPAFARRAPLPPHGPEPDSVDRFRASFLLFLRQPPRADGSRTLGGAGWTGPKSPYSTWLIGVLAFLYAWMTLANMVVPNETGAYTYSREAYGLGLQTFLYAVLVGAAVAAVTHLAVTRTPTCVIGRRRPPDMLRGLASRASLPAVACLICAAVAHASSRPDVVWDDTGFIGFNFDVFAVLFVCRAAFTDAVQQSAPFPGRPSSHRRPAGMSMEAIGCFYMALMAACMLVLIPTGPTRSVALAPAVVLGSILLLALIAFTLAGPSWARCWLVPADRQAVRDLAAVLTDACDQGLLTVEAGAYHLTDPVLARHYERTPSTTSVVRGIPARRVTGRHSWSR